MKEVEPDLDGLLAEGTRVSGSLSFQRAVRIDGRFQGKVRSAGHLILGPRARVEAEIDVGELEVLGHLRGRVRARVRTIIRSGGRVEAEIHTSRLAVEPGAWFRGRCDMPGPGGPGAGTRQPPAEPSRPGAGEAGRSGDQR